MIGNDEYRVHVLDINWLQCLSSDTKLSAYPGILQSSSTGQYTSTPFSVNNCNITETISLNTSFHMYSTILLAFSKFDRIELNITFRELSVIIPLYGNDEVTEEDLPKLTTYVSALSVTRTKPSTLTIYSFIVPDVSFSVYSSLVNVTNQIYNNHFTSHIIIHFLSFNNKSQYTKIQNQYKINTKSTLFVCILQVRFPIKHNQIHLTNCVLNYNFISIHFQFIPPHRPGETQKNCMCFCPGTGSSGNGGEMLYLPLTHILSPLLQNTVATAVA